MVVRNTLFSAMCVAGLLTVAAVKPAQAGAKIILNNDIYTFVVSPGATVTIQGTYKSDKTIKNGLFFLGGLDPNLQLVSVPPNIAGTKVGNFSFKVKLLNPGSYDTVLAYSDKGTTSTFPTASLTFTITSVPEPGAVAFGVLAAGSVAGLVLRKRRKMA